jgi:ABC-2 type transport system permease protein
MSSRSVSWPGFADAWRGEWIKARTVASTGWLFAATAVSGVALSAGICALVHYQPGGGQDPTKLALTGVQLAQALIAIWAARAVTGEYRSGMIRTTLTATPQRGVLLAAKVAVITLLALLAGTVTVAGSLLAGHALLTANGFTTTHGLPLSLDTGPVIRAGIGSILYLALIALLAIGIAVVVRDSAAVTGLVLGLLYLFPLSAQLAGNATLQRHLQQIGPTTAGLNIQATTNLDALPISPWAGLAVLMLWAAASLLVAALMFGLRDT